MHLIEPYGGTLVDLLVRDDLVAYAATLPSIQLTPRAQCDLEMLATGGFSPLTRFLGARDYARVLEEMRLADGTLWPMPITLPVEKPLEGDVVLRSAKNEILAILTVEEVYE